jgi:tRNA 2-thiouridine synthesizing protein A
MRAAGSSVGNCAIVTSHAIASASYTAGPMDFDRELDARGLNCPLPILRAKKALAELNSGQVLKVLATDPGALRDFQAFSKQTGHQLVSHSEERKEFTFFMRKK